jgi:RimJ/RimL family protein N-acetyltransferase
MNSHQVTLETERLLLREFVEADFATTHNYGSDPEVTRFLIWGPNSDDQTRDYLQRIIAQQREEPRQGYVLAIVLKNGGLHIGACGMRINSLSHREAEIGYVLGRDNWGRGYATEATKAIVKFGFEQLQLHRIMATAALGNTASQKVLLKTGMKREGTLREHLFVRGAWRDSAMFSVLEQEHRRLDRGGPRESA